MFAGMSPSLETWSVIAGSEATKQSSWVATARRAMTGMCSMGTAGRRILAAGMIACLGWMTALPAETRPAPAPDPLEEQVAAIAADPRVTVVRFWAPWCPNCKAEMTADGWTKFIAAHPDVQFVLVCIWHRGQDPAAALAQAGIGGQPNVTLLTHPNPSSKAADRLDRFMGLPVTWVPTTWVFREGRLRFAFNYGEMRFDLLRQLIDDARNEWKH